MKITKELLISHIQDIITSEVYLRDVPYSMVEGAMEVDPCSVDDAAKAIVNLLIKDNLVNVDN